MNRIIRAGVTGLAGLVGVGIASVGAGAATGAVDSKDMFLNKRELSSMVLAVEDDDDNDAKDDTNTGTGTGNQTWSRTGNSNDGTGSAHTAVSRDRDRSRGDKTRDWTRDGGDRTRDFSRFLTNDGSRNDTRGRR